MARKFISVLGATDYKNCKYSNGNEIVSTRFIQEALLDMYFKEHKEGDKIVIFLTEMSRKRNWVNNEEKIKGLGTILEKENWDEDKMQKIKEKVGNEVWEDRTGDNKKIGLKEILSKKYPDIVNVVDIKEGKSEEDIWDTFEKIYESFDDGDEVIFDITYGFRSIPMQALTVLNYAKVLKNIKVKGIYYGAFEAKDKETGIAPIFDLTSYDEILEWTSAVNAFIAYGNGNAVYDLYNKKNELKKKNKDYSLNKSALNKVVTGIKDFTNCIQTSRGRLFKEGVKKEGDKFKKCTHEAALLIRNSLKKLQSENTKLIKPLFPLLNKINDKISGFYENDNLKVGISTIHWCIKYKMTQQGYTAFEETLKTYLCRKYGFSEYGERIRDKIVKKALNDISYNREQKLEPRHISDDKCKEFKIEDDFIEYKSVLETVPIEFVDLIKYSKKRNDISHFGFTADFLDYDNLNNNLNTAYETLKCAIEKYKDIQFN